MCTNFFISLPFQDTFPRGKYQIVVTVLDDGTLPGAQVSNNTSCLSAGITCATLALVHAGVQLYDLAIGLDLDASNLNASGEASLSVAVMPQLRQLTMVNSTRLALPTPLNLKSVLDAAFTRAAKMHTSLQSMLFSSLEEEFNAMEETTT